jgi:nitroreductase
MTTLNAIPEAALDQLFRKARTVHAFKPVPVTDELIHKLYDLVKWGPTAYNAQPARYVFVRSEEAKARLKPAVSSGNAAQTLAAGVTVIVAHDTRFYEHLPTQFPAYDAKPFFEKSAEAAAGHGLSQQQPAGRLPDPGRALARPGRGAAVGLQRGAGRQGVLSRRPLSRQLPRESRRGRSRRHLPARAAARVRRRGGDPLISPSHPLFISST